MCCSTYRILILFTFVVIAFFMNNFFPSVPVVLWYLVSINIFTFLLFIIDKYYALKNRARVPEVILYFISFAGGIFGAFLAMLISKHKTSKNGFFYFQLAILMLWSFAIHFVIANIEAIQLALKELTK